MKHIKPTTRKIPAPADECRPICFFCIGILQLFGKSEGEADMRCMEKGKCDC